MLFLPTVLSLAGSSAWARVRLQEAISMVEGERERAGGGKVFVNPAGPLNILCGHALVNNDAMAKKRKYSAPIRTYYTLYDFETGPSGALIHEFNRTYEYGRNPANDEICDFTSSEEMDYLHAYYDTLKILFRIANGTVTVSTNHHASFYKYTRVQLTDSERARFFAALLLLAGGEGIEARYKEVSAGSKGRQQQNPSSVALTCGKCTLLELNLKTRDVNCKRPQYAKEVRAVIDFFVGHGATDVAKLGLHYTDAPSFLIQAYICEYAENGAFIGEVFNCVDALLAEIYSGPELDAAYARFFTTDSELLGSFSKKYGVLKRIDKILCLGQFPFSSSNTPLMNQIVHCYDEVTGSICIEISYSDCVEIALYNFLCCMLYDPETCSYSTEHLGSKGCSPTERFVDFFTRICTGPEDNGGAEIHQEWARVVQGLTLHPAGDAEGRNLIRYCKPSEHGVPVELSACMGNFLFVLAKILGLPETMKRDLEDAVANSLAAPRDETYFPRIAGSFSDVIRMISISPVKSEIRGVCIDGEKRDCICGTLVLSFPPMVDGVPCNEVRLIFHPLHVSFTHKPHKNTLSEEERKFFEDHGKEARDDGGPLLLGLIRDCAKRFLSIADRALLPSACTAEIEAARDPMALYTALADWLAHTPMHSHIDLLVAIDQLFPAFTELLKQGRSSKGTNERPDNSLPQNSADVPSTGLQNEHFSATGQAPVASNPLVLLIANILGSLPLSDFATREPFFRAVLSNCANERAVLFPNIRIHPSLYRQVTDVERRTSLQNDIWRYSNYRVPNIASHYLKELATLGPTWSPGNYWSKQTGISPIVALLENFYVYGHPGSCAVEMLMTCRHTEGTELVRSIIMPDGVGATVDHWVKRAFWFCMVVKRQFYSEAYWVCTSGNDFEFAVFYDERIRRYFSVSHGMPPLSKGLIASIFPNGPTPSQFKLLLGLYALFASAESDYARIYDMLESVPDEQHPVFVLDICRVSAGALLHHCENNCKFLRDRYEEQLKMKLQLMNLNNFISKVEQLYAAQIRLSAGLRTNLYICSQKIAECEYFLQNSLQTEVQRL